MNFRNHPYYEKTNIHITVEVEQPKYCPEHTPAISLYPMDLVWLMLVFWAFIAFHITKHTLKGEDK